MCAQRKVFPLPAMCGALAVSVSGYRASTDLVVSMVPGGAAAKRRLEETEARLADTLQYVTERG